MLKQEIEKTGLTDGAEIVAYFNTPSIFVKDLIETKAIKQYLTLRDLRVVIKNNPSNACQSATLALDDFETFNCANPLIFNKLALILNDLVSENIGFSLDDKNYILALADKTISLAESLGLDVNFQTIAHALEG